MLQRVIQWLEQLFPWWGLPEPEPEPGRRPDPNPDPLPDGPRKPDRDGTPEEEPAPGAPDRAGNPPIEEVVAHISARARERGLPERIGLAIAWTESEMRQFAASGEPLRHINRNARGVVTSSDWGMMQINDRVWGSRFDLKRIKWDWRYNVDAGLEVAADVYGKAQAAREPDPAAATYAGYNAGYRHMDRYRRRSDTRDRRFKEIFQRQPWLARKG